jgi:hypothetical protein
MFSDDLKRWQPCEHPPLFDRSDGVWSIPLSGVSGTLHVDAPEIVREIHAFGATMAIFVGIITWTQIMRLVNDVRGKR